MAGPLVSVLMTSYNREKYIGAAIESVLASTYTNFELIITDDRSKDNTVEIARKYAANDNRVKVFVNEKNLGQFPNRNYAASLANGKYLKYLDSDDLIYPNGLEILVNMMEKFPEAGYGLCSLEQDEKYIFPFMLSPQNAYKRHFLDKIALFHKAPLSSIFKKDIFFQVGGFTNPAGEGDYEMWLALSTKFDVVLMPHGIVWYREHEDQIDFIRRTDPLVRFYYFLVTLKYLGPNCPLDQMQAKKVAAETHLNMVKYIIVTFLKNSPKKAVEMYKLANYKLPQFINIVFRSVISKLKK
jgi:glycosyltransferase involved in cell wall biosynthesis